MNTKIFLFLIFISFQVYSQKLEMLIYKADSALNKGNATIALQYYSRAIKLDTTNAYLYIRRGICFKYLDDNKSAISDLTKGLNKSTLPENKLLAYKERGKAYRNSGSYYNAFKDFIIFGTSYPDDKINNELLVDCIDKIERMDSCKYYITEILSNNNIDNKYFLFYYRCLFNTQLTESEEAISDLNSMKTEYQKKFTNDTILELKYQYNFRMAARYEQLDSFNLADVYINKSLSLIPYFETALLLKAIILIDKKDFDIAEKQLKSLDKGNLKDVDYYWGQLYIQQKKYKEAINAFKKNLTKMGEQTYVYNKIGFCYSRLKLFNEAKKFYVLSIKLDSIDPSPYNSIAWNYFLEKKHNEGIPYTDKCLKLDSLNANYIDTRGCLLYGLNKFNESIECFNKAIKLNPTLTNSYIYRARGYIKLNDKTKACSDFNIASKLIQKKEYDYDYSDLKNYQIKYCK